MKLLFKRGKLVLQVINQSIKIYIAPLQGPYLEALPAQSKH